MEIAQILNLLKNAGFNVKGHDGAYIYIEDPSCILRAFENFLTYAWIIITLITMMLLFGWAISLIRGAKTDLTENMRNLLIILGTLTVIGPILNTLFNGDFIGQGCKNTKVSIAEINKILDARKSQMSNLSESMDIYDSGPLYDDIPLSGASSDDVLPQPINVEQPVREYISDPIKK